MNAISIRRPAGGSHSLRNSFCRASKRLRKQPVRIRSKVELRSLTRRSLLRTIPKNPLLSSNTIPPLALKMTALANAISPFAFACKAMPACNRLASSCSAITPRTNKWKSAPCVVHKADGTSVTAGPDAVKEMTAPVARDAPVYTDYKEKHITVPSLRPGETLEYKIVTRACDTARSRAILVRAQFS